MNHPQSLAIDDAGCLAVPPARTVAAPAAPAAPGRWARRAAAHVDVALDNLARSLDLLAPSAPQASATFLYVLAH